MKRTIIILSMMLFAVSCSMPSSATGNQSAQNADQPSAGASQNRCGDDVCDGPENAGNCPEDCTLLAEIGAEPDPKIAQGNQTESANTSESGYRYVSFSGSIFTALNSDLMGDFTGTAFEYSGDYSIELWFPMQGGEAVQQRNSITLTEFKDLYFRDDTCTPCDWILDKSAYEPVKFELDASLNIEGIREDDQTADELVYQLSTIPGDAITGIVQCPCEGSAPDEFVDPAAYTQMLGWFMQGIRNPIHLNVLESNTVENFAISPMGYLNIPKETLSYIIVPNLSTP